MDVLERARRLLLVNMDVESVMVEISTSPGAVNSLISASDFLNIVKEQSARLSMSPVLMATKLFCARLKTVNSNIEQDCSNNDIDSVLMVGKCLQENRLIGYHCLTETIRKEIASIGLFVLWKLSVADFISIKDVINCDNEWQMEVVSEILTKELVNYLQASNPPLYRNQIVDDYSSVIFEALSVTEGTLTDTKLLAEAAKNILFSLIRGNYTDDNIQSNSFYSFLESSSLLTVANKENVYKTILQHFVTLPPLVTVQDSLPNQTDYRYCLVTPSITKLFNTITIGLGSSVSWTVITEFIHQNQKLNWSSFLSFISCFVQCHSETFSIKEHIREIIESLFGETAPTFNKSLLYGTIVIARQCDLEGSHVFPSYSEWFKQMFGDVSKSVIQSKTSLGFLLESLADIIPYDPPYCLRAHLKHLPRKLPKYQPMVYDYLDLVKLRLSELNEPCDTLASFGGQNTTELILADTDVQEVLQSYDCHTIPNKVREMNMFNPTYYKERFLKSLLTPIKIPEISDARSKLISALAKSDMIPQTFLKKYNDDCKKLMSNEISDYSPLYDSLVTELQRVVRHINDDEVKFKGVLSKLSNSIATVINEASQHCKPCNATNGVLLDLSAPGLQEWQIEINNLILSCLCECILKLCIQLAKPDPVSFTHFNSIGMFVKMLSCHVTVHKGLLIRLWELLHLQINDHTDEQLLSLSVLLAEFYISHTHYSSINVKWCCSLYNLVTVSEIKTSSDYATFLLNSLNHPTATGIINTGKILCHLFQHFSTTSNNVVFEVTPSDANATDCFRMSYIKLKYFHDRISFHSKEGMDYSKQSKTELDVLLKMICRVMEQPIIQTAFSIDKDEYLKASLQFDFMLHTGQDYLTPLQRHAFRRSLILSLGDDNFQTMFCFLMFLEYSKAKHIPFCSPSHEEMFNYLTTIGFNEGIQLLMELSSGLTCHNECHLFSFLLSKPDLCSVVIAKLNATDPLLAMTTSDTALINSCLNCILALPSYLFYSSSITTVPSEQALITSMDILKKIMGPLLHHGLIAPFSLTCHLFKGILQFSSALTLWSERLNYLLDCSPIFLASLLFWWDDLRKHLPDALFQSDTPLQTLDNVTIHVQRGTIQSSPYLQSHCEATAVCIAGLISASRLGHLSPTAFLQQITLPCVQQHAWNRTFQLFLAECCVRIILTNSSVLFEVAMFDGCLSNDNDIMNTLQYIINIDSSRWLVLLNEEQREVFSDRDRDMVFDQLTSFRNGLSVKPVHYHHLLLLVFLTKCSKQVLNKLLDQDGFLQEFFMAHEDILNNSADFKEKSMCISQEFLKSCFILARLVISNSSKAKLQKCLDVCHVGIQLFIQDIIA